MTTATNLPIKDLRKSLFDRYDPFTTTIPELADHEARWTIDYVLTRTREVLKGRSRDDLLKAYWFLRNLMREAEHKLTKAATKRIRQPSGPKSEYLTQPKAILELFSSYDLEDDGPLTNGTPEDYFSVLALMEAFEAIAAHFQAEELASKANLDALEKSILAGCDRAISTSAKEASELISFIDGMMFRRQEQGKAGRKGARQKDSKLSTIREQVLARYSEAYSELSNRKAAMILEAEFSEELSKALKTEDINLRIEKWIGAHKRKSHEK